MMFWLVIPFILGIIFYIIYKKYSKPEKLSADIPQYDHAIIIGGSIGGMVTAAYLTKYFSRITIIESDDVLSDTLFNSTPEQILDYRCRLESPTSLGRSGVSQMYQAHSLAGEGIKIIRELFPQLEHKLQKHYGARIYSFKADVRLVLEGLLINQDLTDDFQWFGVDRLVLETVMRQELCSQFEDQIRWKCKSRVTQLIVNRSLNLVKGVQYRCKENNELTSIDLYGDFIIDCSGRSSSSTKWLKESLNIIIPNTQIHFGDGYVTFVGERMKIGNPSIDSKPIIIISPTVPVNNKGFGTMPLCTIEPTDKNSLGILSTLVIYCVNSEFAPNDSYENLLEWTKENMESDCYLILKSTKVRGPLIPYRRAFDNRKYVELVGQKWPHNYILLGDSMCTFNPQFGQGMTHASRQARELVKIFAENCHQLKDISHIYNRRASAISEECWFASTTNDWKTSTLKIIQTDKNGETKTYYRGDGSTAINGLQPRVPLMIEFSHWYNRWLLQCASKSGGIATDFLCLMNQHCSPLILFKPKTLLAICCTALMHYFSLSKKSTN